MHKGIEFELSHKQHSFLSMTKEYFIGNGFSVTSENSNHLTFKRGSKLLNIITLNPLKWESAIEVTIVNNTVVAEFEISTFGQDITHKENALWDSFIDNYRRTIIDGLDFKIENRRQLNNTLLYNLSYVKWAILGAIVAGVPSGIFAYYTGVESIASIGAIVGALGLMMYKLDKEKLKK